MHAIHLPASLGAGFDTIARRIALLHLERRTAVPAAEPVPFEALARKTTVGVVEHPWIAEMEQLSREVPTYPTIEVGAQVTFGMLASLMWRRADHPRLDHWVERATALLESEASPDLRMRLAAYLSFYWMSWRGDLAAADRLLDQVRPLVSGPDVTPLSEVLWFVMVAHCRARAGDPTGCFSAVERGLATARRSGVLRVNHIVAIQGVYGGLIAGDLAAARGYLDLVRAGLGDEKANRTHFELLGAWVAMGAGDLRGAEARARAACACARASGGETLVAVSPYPFISPTRDASARAGHRGRSAPGLDQRTVEAGRPGPPRCPSSR